MLVTSFLAWIENATPRERCEAVDMLAQALLAETLGEETPQAAIAALTLVIDDSSRLVRRTLACAFAEHLLAPRHIVLALAQDQADVAAPLLARSPVLQEADLIELAAGAEPRALLAIALRPVVSVRTSHALIARQDREVALALAGNPGADISDDDLLAIATIFGGDQRIRDSLLQRGRVPATVRYQLMIAVSECLDGFVAGGFLPQQRQRRTFDEALLQGAIDIAVKAGEDLPSLVRHLRQTARLTPGLLLRSVLGGDLALLAQSLAELSGLERGRVVALMRGRVDATLVALFRRSGLPEFLHAPLVAAVRAAQELHPNEISAELSLPVIRAAQSACLALDSGEDVRLLALLRRYEAEAARAESLRLAEDLRAQAQTDFGQLRLTSEQVEGMALLGSDEPEAAVSVIEPEVVQPAALDPAPDLRTVIAEWKREREARLGKPDLPPSAAAANEDPAFTGWELRLRSA